MKRFGVVLARLLRSLLAAVSSGKAAPYTADKAVKINVMGEWAHPDDDTSIIGPCGVWHQRYDVRCGIIMVTRGEGGGNATGTERPGARPPARERGPRRALPLRHDRHLQRRPGRLLLQHERAADRVLLGHRDPAPDHADHPHDPAGRLHRLHADARPPATATTRWPAATSGRASRPRPTRPCSRSSSPARTRSAPGRSRRSSPAAPPRHRRHDHRRGLHHRLPPRRDQPGHGRGRVDRLRLAVPVAGRQRPGPTAGTPKIWAQVASEGGSRLPDAEPRDEQGHVEPRLLALRHDRLLRAVPAERQPDGTPTRPPARTTRSSTARRSRTRAGCPLGTLEYLTFSRSSTRRARPSRRRCNLGAGGHAAGRAPSH